MRERIRICSARKKSPRKAALKSSPATPPNLLGHVAERQAYLDLLLSGSFYEQLAPGKDWDRPKIKTAFFNQIAYGS